MLESSNSFGLPASCNWLVRDCSLRWFLVRQPDSRSLKSSKALGIVGRSHRHCYQRATPGQEILRGNVMTKLCP